MKKTLIILSIVILLAFLAIFIQSRKKSEFEWQPTYLNYDTDPYGCKVLFDQLNYFFSNKKVKRLGRQLDSYEYYVRDDYSYVDDVLTVDSTKYEPEYIDAESVRYFNLFLLNDYLYFDRPSSETVLLHVYQGNDALLVAEGFEGDLVAFFNIEVASLYANDTLDLTSYYNLKVRDGSFKQYKVFESASFISDYPLNAEVLVTNKNGDAVAIKIKLGKGNIIFCTLPIVFTNYYLLYDRKEMSSQLIKTLPIKDTFWARGLSQQGGYTQSESLLKFIHSQPPLAWGFYVLLISVLLFFIFQIKRKERAIPIQLAPENVSLKFADTISNLYLLRKNNHIILRNKMMFLLEHFRSNYQIDTNEINQAFYHKLANKTGVKESVISFLFQEYNRLNKKPTVSDDELVKINKIMQQFKRSKYGK